MKITEFKFEIEQDMDAANEILIRMRESKPVPRIKISYVAVALGEKEARDLKEEMQRRGIPFKVTMESQIPDDQFVHA